MRVCWVGGWWEGMGLFSCFLGQAVLPSILAFLSFLPFSLPSFLPRLAEAYKVKNDPVFAWRAARLIARHGMSVINDLSVVPKDFVCPPLRGEEGPPKPITTLNQLWPIPPMALLEPMARRLLGIKEKEKEKEKEVARAAEAEAAEGANAPPGAEAAAVGGVVAGEPAAAAAVAAAVEVAPGSASAAVPRKRPREGEDLEVPGPGPAGDIV